MHSKPFQGKCRIVVNSSLRKRMRAVRRGFTTALEPSQKALMRHSWYRRKLAWEALRHYASA